MILCDTMCTIWIWVFHTVSKHRLVVLRHSNCQRLRLFKTRGVDAIRFRLQTMPQATILVKDLAPHHDALAHTPASWVLMSNQAPEGEEDMSQAKADGRNLILLGEMSTGYVQDANQEGGWAV